jgi:hypothetical protein
VLKGIQRIAGEGYPEIDPRDFSVVFFHAASLPTFELVFSLAGHGGFLSEAFVGRMSERWLEERQAYRLAAELKRTHSDARISLIAQPYPRDGADEFGGISASDELREKVNARLKKAANAAGLDFVFQPAGTVIRGCYTMKQYATNSVRLTGRMDVKHPSDESFHMNSQFGAEMLRLVLPDLAAVPA